MTTINSTNSNEYNIQKSHANNTGKVEGESKIHPLVAEGAQSFITLAKQPGVMSSILDGQSIIANFDIRPALSAPPVGQKKINAEQTNELMKLTATMKGSDIHKLELAAASNLAVFNSPSRQQTARNSNQPLPISLPSSAVSAHPVHSQMPLEGGTDITATEAPGRQFVNMMGDLKMMELNSKLVVTLMKQEAEFARSAVNSSLRAVNAAERSGNKGIDAEKQRMTGAITSGALGLIGQGVTTTRTVKALGRESKSINDNLSAAIKIDSAAGAHQSSISASTDNMLHKNTPLQETVTGTMESMNTSVAGFDSEKRLDHNQIQIKSNKTRVTSEYSNTGINSSQKVIDGAFNVEAANENKQAELARADQSVNNEIANTNQQAAKKAADAKAALNQAFENAQNSRNSVNSSIADKIH